MPRGGLFHLIHLPPDLAQQMKESVDEAFLSLGGATAELVLHYVREKHHVDMTELPEGIEELDKALKDVLGAGSHIVVSRCAEILSRRIGKNIDSKSNKLADVFRQVLKVYKRPKLRAPEKEIASLLGEPELEESLLGDPETE